jgi:hypothetical protein
MSKRHGKKFPRTQGNSGEMCDEKYPVAPSDIHSDLEETISLPIVYDSAETYFVEAID